MAQLWLALTSSRVPQSPSLHEGAGWARERPGALPALDLVPGCLETDT